ncbi:hypothetical protein PtrSN002B_005313 [Pyrenophora tritici-repentis]|uniref:Uncharacterized protein n=1 Tax=Pyrenophora tritici-repentis TaxID=45151 RepID=A0A2W1EJ44_9PLEO|nr:hypothetical protein PtrV1_01872 [Pyrenophora tritici-repentis]KAF7454603.1 hypothetical protein A1F99_018610 [Pyrenophora tritici-repentis]KAF7577726.1 hypothetical protein PtrM4_019660 [Pyrenophora tritici-repentis]KAI0580218.1 hypothetical protein Alg215_05345 [Pyrenophora tritici-repentis]KAI0581817.1 hypothetical protein Alg130_06406 [Pyrenophora tritici-repentis]
MRHRDIIWLQCDPAVDWQLAGHSKAQPHNATGYDASANQMVCTLSRFQRLEHYMMLRHWAPTIRDGYAYFAGLRNLLD